MSGNCCPRCIGPDINHDGYVGTDADYEAFFAALDGGIINSPQASLKDLPFGFRGYRWDDHLKIYHVRHRDYDPVSFRWLQQDPAGFVDGMNLYAYCGGIRSMGWIHSASTGTESPSQFAARSSAISSMIRLMGSEKSSTRRAILGKKLKDSGKSRGDHIRRRCHGDHSWWWVRCNGWGVRDCWRGHFHSR